jgi:hypothetical protein
LGIPVLERCVYVYSVWEVLLTTALPFARDHYVSILILSPFPSTYRQARDPARRRTDPQDHRRAQAPLARGRLRELDCRGARSYRRG